LYKYISSNKFPQTKNLPKKPANGGNPAIEPRDKTKRKADHWPFFLKDLRSLK
jgi:hypothetical protein